jgi:hypothetical protein
MIEIKYSGGNLGDNLNDAIKKIIIEKANSIKQAIMPFEKEIKKSNGQVIIQVLNYSKIDIQPKNLPQELFDKITKAVSQLLL